MNRKERRAKEKQKSSPKAQAEKYYRQGLDFANRNNLAQAYPALKKAVELHKTKPDYLYACGTTAMLLGQRNDAFDMLSRAVKFEPDNQQFISQLVNAAQGVSIPEFDKSIKETLVFCLKQKNLGLQTTARLWFQLLQLDHSLKPIFDIQEDTQLSDIPEKNLTRAMADDFLILGLRRLITKDKVMEAWLTRLRRKLLDYVLENHEGAKLVTLLSVIAQHCFLNEYVFYYSDDEKENIRTIQKQIEDGDHSETLIACFGMFEKLSDLSNREELEQRYKDGIIDDLIVQQISNTLEEQRLMKEIKSFVPVSDQTSKDVQAMYEENPYPRWEAVPPTTRYYPNDKGSYLVAGSGTGRSPCTMAKVMPNMDITGIDLSRVSLAYAQRKANELGFDNIEFAHLDILNIDKLDKKFDALECGGVLHHMKDPMEGWRSLLKVLAPGGRMLIGLYSENARKHIVAGQKLAKEKGYDSNPDGIRAFRQDVFQLSEDHPAYNVSMNLDFYSTSSCRDLCFHVQEERYTLQQLHDMMEELDLECLGFVPNFPEVATLYRQQFLNDPQMKNYKNWEKLEEMKPEICVGMYNFWCMRKADKGIKNDIVQDMIRNQMIPG